MKFRIYRYDPERDEKPRLQEYEVALDPHDRMLLDALIRLKTIDDSLSFRRSCLRVVLTLFVKKGNSRSMRRARCVSGSR